MAKAVIIGAGPAGISAALYLARAGIDTTVIYRGIGALEKAHQIENYYGFANPISGQALMEDGLQGAKRLGVHFVLDEVLSIGFEQNYIVQTKQGTYQADGVILATGASRNTPKVEGIKEYEGLGVSYCAVCDAFFYRQKNVAVIGSGTYALHEASELKAVAASVAILTDDAPPLENLSDEFKVITTKIAKLKGDGKLQQVVFQDGTTLDIDGLFVAIGTASSTDLARKIGAVIDQNKIVVDANMQTNLPGLYAAGDCTGGLLQISKAVYEGAKAGTELTKFIRKSLKG